MNTQPIRKEEEIFTGTRADHCATFEVSGNPELVFPLLCPIREEEWIEGWTGRVVHSASGVAEPDGVFLAGRDHDPVLYVVSRHEQDRRIEYVVLAPGRWVQRLAIALAPAGQGTEIEFRRVHTGLSPEGNREVERNTEAAFSALIDDLARSLDRHCRSLLRE